ncbi:MAG: hypothetical protein Q8930_01130 [Bacillota bacterium]|nr:hypothetical protein [Bacillota bacterium]
MKEKASKGYAAKLVVTLLGMAVISVIIMALVSKGSKKESTAPEQEIVESDYDIITDNTGDNTEVEKS